MTMPTPPAPNQAQPPQAPQHQAPQAQAPQAQAPQQWQQQGPGYSSPIPITRTTLGHALASEWTKIKSVRSTMWTLGVMLTLVIGIGVLTALLVSANATDPFPDSAFSFGFFGLLLGSICVITLGVLTIASEYGTGMIRTTLTACPNRARVLTAKALVFFLLVFTLTTAAAALVGAVQVGMIDAQEPTSAEWLRATFGVGLFIALLGLLALSVGALVRHSAGAITIMIGVLLLPLVAAMFMFAESLKDLQEILFEYSVPSMLGGIYGDEMGISDNAPTGWEPVLIMLVLAVVAFGGAIAATNSRDV